MNEDEFNYKDNRVSMSLPAVTKEQVDAAWERLKLSFVQTPEIVGHNILPSPCEPDHHMWTKATIEWDGKTEIRQTQCCLCGIIADGVRVEKKKA